MSEHKYREAYLEGFKYGQKAQCLADTLDDAMYQLSKLGNVTNGDMIKAMFPNVDKYHNMLLENHSKNILFNDDWWNAPYKEVNNESIN